jgi:lipopolysaccharide biosynthesis glycosyltransferase
MTLHKRVLKNSHQEHIVVSSIDDNYVFPLLVMIYSAATNAEFTFRLVLGVDKQCLSRRNQKLIRDFCKIYNIRIDLIEITLDLNIEFNNYLTAPTYARLILADLLPQTFLWIDADVLCLSGWDEIFNSGRDNVLTGVLDPIIRNGVPESSRSNQAITNNQGKYLNAGFLLINPNLWREIQGPVLWRSAFSNANLLGFEFHDQCILNYVAGNSKSIVIEEFNYLVRNEEFLSIRNPRVAHFAGSFKPWQMPDLVLVLKAPKANRGLYRKYAFFQFYTIMKTMKHNPLIGWQLWKKRMQLIKLLILNLPNNMRSAMLIVKNLFANNALSLDPSESEITSISKLEQTIFGKYEVYYSKPNSLLSELFDLFGSDKGSNGLPTTKFP